MQAPWTCTLDKKLQSRNVFNPLIKLQTIQNFKVRKSSRLLQASHPPKIKTLNHKGISFNLDTRNCTKGKFSSSTAFILCKQKVTSEAKMLWSASPITTIYLKALTKRRMPSELHKEQKMGSNSICPHHGW